MLGVEMMKVLNSFGMRGIERDLVSTKPQVPNTKVEGSIHMMLRFLAQARYYGNIVK